MTVCANLLDLFPTMNNSSCDLPVSDGTSTCVIMKQDLFWLVDHPDLFLAQCP